MESFGERVEREENLTVLQPKEHLHTLIWLHGMACPHEKYFTSFVGALGEYKDKVKVICPKAPIRHVTLLKEKASSWFDIKYRGEESFQVPFDEAFSSEEVNDSFEKYKFLNSAFCCH